MSTITLTLTNFRCWENKSITIPSTGIVLLSGRSGRGKSTILNAIVYAVTGTGKNITTFSKKSTTVELSMTNSDIPIMIRRTRGPNRLFVKKGDISYEDDEAQSIIDSIFGTEFCNTSYIDQDNSNSFVFKNPASKMDFLETLLLHAYDIDGMKEKVKNEMGITKTNYSTEDGRIGALSDMLSKIKEIKENISLTIENIVITSSNAEKVREKLKNNLDVCEKNTRILSQKIRKGESDFQTFLTQSEKQKGLERMIDEIRSEMTEKSSTVLSEKLSSLEKKKEHHHLLKRHREWADIFNEVNEMRSKNDKERKRLTDIMSEMKPLSCLKKNLLQLEKANRIIDSLISLEEKIKNPPDFTTNIDECKSKLLEWKESLASFQRELSNRHSCYSCPSCHHILKFSNEKLVMESSVKDLKDTCEISSDIKRLKKQIEEKEKILDEWKVNEASFKKNEKDYNEMFDKLDTLLLLESERVIDQEHIDSEIESITKTIETVSSIELQLKQIDEDSLYRQRVKDEEKMRVHSLLPSEISDKEPLTDSDFSNLLGDISLLKMELDKEKLIRQKYDNLCKEKDSLTNIVNNEEQLNLDREKYELYEKKEKKYRELCVNINEWIQLDKDRISYEKLKSDIKESSYKKEKYIERLKGLTKLRDHIKNAEKNSLDEFIQSLNDHASVYIDEFFLDEDILVELKTIQEGKTSGKEKIALHFDVTYRGMNGDLSFLSGGEKDRVNLAFTLAFSELVDTRMLLLDECISSLDAETTNIVLEHLKEKYKGKLMIVVSHQANLGFFDSVIQI